MLNVWDHCRKVVKARKHAIGKLMVEVYPITVLVQLVFPDSPDDGKIDYKVSRDDTVGKSNISIFIQHTFPLQELNILEHT